MAMCDDSLEEGGVGHCWGAWEKGGVVAVGTLCSCWATQPDGKPGHTPIPIAMRAEDDEWWVTESDLLDTHGVTIPVHGTAGKADILVHPNDGGFEPHNLGDSHG